MRTRLIIAAILIAATGFGNMHLFGQPEGKRELRSTWVASVANIDWPKYEDRNDPAGQQSDLIALLERVKATNMNAIFLQVRPECDALYQSAYEPWSRYLTWTQGDDPGYDPLQFAIDEAHKRGIEVHAWLNPYRINASTNDGGSYYDPTHVYVKHPEWALEYSTGKKILNPGLPEVMSYIGNVVEDIITNYAVDGVHFDDYFYSYDGTPASLDEDAYALYGDGMSVSDWRRDNVNRLMDTVYAVIQKVNPNVRFGVSPFGIYRNGVPQGIVGFDAYSQIYCDPLAWLRSGSVDYLTPQNYWPTGGAQDFETLVNWWADSLSHYGRHLFPGMGTYRLSANPGVKKAVEWQSSDTVSGLHEQKSYFDRLNNGKHLSTLEESLLKGTGDPVSAWTLSEISKQIGLIRSNNDKLAMGSVFFSAKDLDRVIGLRDHLTENSFTHQAIVPEMTWKTSSAPGIPSAIEADTIDSELYLEWDYVMQPNHRFAVYVSGSDIPAEQIIDEPSNLQAITFDTILSFSDLVLAEGGYIVVTAVNAAGKEGIPSERFQIDGLPVVTLEAPADGATIAYNGEISWSSALSSPQYQFQIATNSAFSSIVFNSEWTTNTSFAITNLGLDGESEYFWRVRARTNITGTYSAPRSFITGFPEQPVLESPGNLAQNISTHPTIIWSNAAQADQIRVQVSESTSFTTLSADEQFNAADGTGVLTTQLKKETWYYLRISASNSFGESNFTEFVTFRTTAGEIPDVILLSPANMVTVSSDDLLSWETTATEGTITYNLEVAVDEAFNGIIYNSGWIGETGVVVEDLQIEGNATYYWHVKGKSEFGESEYSASRSFSAGYPTRPSISTPEHLSTGNAVKPAVTWNSDANTDSVSVEFSEDPGYETIYHTETFGNAAGLATISVSLRPFTWYYLRIRAINEFGGSVYSKNKYFETGESIGYTEATGKYPLKIYPVPASGEFITIQWPGNIEINKIIVVSAHGTEICSVIPGQTSAVSGERQVTVPVGGLKAGYYFIRVIGNSNVISAPLLILNQ